MLPAFAQSNPRYKSLVYSKPIGKLLLLEFLGSIRAYVNNVIGSKFVASVFFSVWHRSMRNSVLRILRNRPIFKIFYAVISAYAIQMPANMPDWARPNKSQKNKRVNTKMSGFSMLVQSNRKVPSIFSSLLTNNSTFGCRALYAFNAPNVGRFIKAFIAGNFFPDFFHVVAPSNAPKCKIHGSQWSDWFSGANLAMSFHYNKMKGVR